MKSNIIYPLISLPLAIVAHLVGDFLLQNHWMQQKSKSSYVCSIHVFCYAMPFLFMVKLGLISGWQYLFILLEHWFQDRFGLHLKWMKFYRQTTPDLWPVGPLCMDQSWHLAFITLVLFIPAFL